MSLSFDLEQVILFTIFLIISSIYLFSSLTPTFDGDSLFGYLSLAREYSIHNKIIPIDYYYGSTFPQNGQLLTTLGFLLNDQITAQLVISWLMGILCCLVIFSFGKSIGNIKSGLIAVVIFYGSYSVAFINQSAKIDLAWAFFDLLGVYAFFKWFFSLNDTKNKNNSNWLLISGLLLSIAIGIKQVSAFTIIIIFFAIIIFYFLKYKFLDFGLFRNILFFSIPIIISFHWIIRSYILSEAFVYTASELPNNHGILGFFITIWEMSMLGSASSIEGSMGKAIGPILLAVLPLFLITKKIDSRVKSILIFCFLMSIFWYNGVQRARHFFTAIALLSICAGYIINHIIKINMKGRKFFLVVIIFFSFFNILPWVYVNIFSINKYSYLMKRDLNQFLEQNLDKWKWYPNFAVTNYVKNELPKDIKIAALSTGNSYYLERKFYGARKTLIGPSFIDLKNDVTISNFLKKLKKYQITHVFLNEHVIEKWNLQDCWLNDRTFKEKNMTMIITKDGQSLYKIVDE